MEGERKKKSKSRAESRAESVEMGVWATGKHLECWRLGGLGHTQPVLGDKPGEVKTQPAGPDAAEPQPLTYIYR